jgi:hypothetical protein
MGHALMENRHGMLVDFQVTHATGTAERDALPKLLDDARERRFHPRTLGGDKGYDTRDCVDDMRERLVTPHVAQNTSGRRSAIDGRTTRHPGYAISQRIRETGRGGLRLDEDGRRLPPDAVPGLRPHRPGRLPRRDRLQLGQTEPTRGETEHDPRRSLTRRTRLG